MRKAALPIVLILGLLLAACSGAAPSEAPSDSTPAVDESRAVDIATDAFTAFNEGDYSGWSRDWSDAMRSAIPQEAFEAWRASVLDELGRFVSLGIPERSERQPGTYRWSFPVTFERGAATIGFAFAGGGNRVEGVFVE
jgi:hypothetical protein